MNKEEDSGKLSNSLDSLQRKQVLLRGGGIQAIWSGWRETKDFSLYDLLLHNITTNLELLIGCTYYLTVSVGQKSRDDLTGSSKFHRASARAAVLSEVWMGKNLLMWLLAAFNSLCCHNQDLSSLLAVLWKPPLPCHWFSWYDSSQYGISLLQTSEEKNVRALAI